MDDEKSAIPSQDIFCERNFQTNGDLNYIIEETNDDLSVEKEEPLWDHSPKFLIGDVRHHWEDSMKTN